MTARTLCHTHVHALSALARQCTAPPPRLHLPTSALAPFPPIPGAPCRLPPPAHHHQLHPAAAHSDYGVLLLPMAGPHAPQLGWLDLQITNRLINQVQCGRPRPDSPPV